jgi:hypothetical protein
MSCALVISVFLFQNLKENTLDKSSYVGHSSYGSRGFEIGALL